MQNALVPNVTVPPGWRVVEHDQVVTVLRRNDSIAWPRGTAPWYDRYSGFLFVAGALVAALVYYVLGGPGARTAIDAHPLDTEGAGAEGAVAPGSEHAGSDVPVFTEPAV